MSSGPVSLPLCAKSVVVKPAGTVTPPLIGAGVAAAAGTAKPNEARAAARLVTEMTAARIRTFLTDATKVLLLQGIPRSSLAPRTAGLDFVMLAAVSGASIADVKPAGSATLNIYIFVKVVTTSKHW